MYLKGLESMSLTNDDMQSETLKYLYLLFSDETVLPLDRKANSNYSGFVADRTVQVTCLTRKHILFPSSLVAYINRRNFDI